MPIRWTISHEERLVVATTEGVVTLKDIEAYLDALVVADAAPYAKLFDASDLDLQATDHDVMMLGARMRAYAATWPGGPLAFVVTTRLAREFVDRFLNLAAAPRPVNIFRTADEARRWLYAALAMVRAIVLATASDQPEITTSDRLYAEALERRGFAVVGAPWDGPRAAFDGAAAVVIRSTWGYYRTSDAFRDWTEEMAAASRLFNPVGLVRWNLRKDYIAKLAAAAVRVPQTHFVACEVDAIDGVFGETGWSRAVVKPLTGASGYSVELVTREGVADVVSRLAAEARSGGVLVQEFLPEIADGELSLIYFDGIFSHAVRKRPPQGEFRVNSRFGATRSAEIPSRAVTEQGAAALRTLPELPLYARVDGIVRDGTLIVIEVEVLEPALFLDFGSAERFAAATIARF